MRFDFALCKYKPIVQYKMKMASSGHGRPHRRRILCPTMSVPGEQAQTSPDDESDKLRHFQSSHTVAFSLKALQNAGPDQEYAGRAKPER